jgi:hypothetical protein
MGKYDDVVKQYPRVQPVAGPFQEKVNALKQGLVDTSAYTFAVAYEKIAGCLPGAIVNRTPEGLAKAYLQLVDAKKAHDAAEKPLNVMLAAVEQLMLAEFEARDIDEMVVGGEKVKFDNGLSTKTTDPGSFYAWVRDNKMEALLTMNASRIASLTKQRILDGLPIPDGIEVKSWRQASPRSGSNETE